MTFIICTICLGLTIYLDLVLAVLPQKSAQIRHPTIQRHKQNVMLYAAAYQRLDFFRIFFE